MPSVSPSRRFAALLGAVALAVGACSGGAPEPAPPPNGSIAALRAGAVQLSLLQAQSQITAGADLFTFGLATSRGELVTGGSPEVWVARDDRTEALGPFTAAYHEFEAGERFPNEAPRSPLTGFYAVDVRVPAPGTWMVAGVAREGANRLVGAGSLNVVSAEQAPAAIGTEALAIETPVGTTEEELVAICTREPPDPMHYISLDDALGNGKPTVVNFGTPLLCTSQMCGPVVDEMLAVHDAVGRERANFVHVEIYPKRDQREPAPEFLAYGFVTEPWTLVIDREGIIRARFEGPVVTAQIQAALEPLL